jgi:nitrite reductase (NADH) large subunit
LLGLIALVAHTGFRLGHNLNFGLMLVFLASALSGGISGGLAAATTQTVPDSPVGRIADAFRKVHDFAFWPLPVLVGFHVLKVYYF